MCAPKCLYTKTSAIFIVAIFLFFGMPAYAHAGIFSFLSNLFDRSNTEELIARSFNSQNVALLQAALNHDPNPSKGGGDITIVGDSALLPDVGPLGTIADVENSVLSSDQISIYVVREADSLSQIAKIFGVTVNTIIWANNIRRGNLIYEGQTLIILPVTGLQYTVKSGDTLASIAKKYKGDADEIAQFNDIPDAAELAIGEIIIIPDGELGTPSYSARIYSAQVRGAGGPTYTGYYLKPILGARRTQGLHGYNAVDLGAPYGTPVLASANGDVIIGRSSGWNGGYGKYIVISHSNGTQTLYSHLGEIIVTPGWQVVKGQVIGYVGSTGRSTGPHVHFEIRGAKNPF